MIARIRGEHDARWDRSPPLGVRNPAVAARASSRPRSSATRLSWRGAIALVAAVTALAAGVAAALGGLTSRPAQPRLPASPRSWLDSYEAAAIDNPLRVCSELFAPQLAAAYGRAMRGNCTSYFARITSFSVAIRRVLQDGDTAVLELRQTVLPRDWAVVLTRRAGGWQAVDLLAGDLVR